MNKKIILRTIFVAFGLFLLISLNAYSQNNPPPGKEPKSLKQEIGEPAFLPLMLQACRLAQQYIIGHLQQIQ